MYHRAENHQAMLSSILDTDHSKVDIGSLGPSFWPFPTEAKGK